VRIDEAGQERSVAKLDDSSITRHYGCRSDTCYCAALNDDNAGRDDLFASPIKQSRSSQYDRPRLVGLAQRGMILKQQTQRH
jgi:hypothetical protein